MQRKVLKALRVFVPSWAAKQWNVPMGVEHRPQL